MSQLRTGLQLTRAHEAIRAGRLGEAEELCRSVLKQDRRSVDALNMLGHVLFRRHRYAEAERYLKQCTSLAPKEPSYHNQLAQVYRAQGRLKEAVARFDRILRLRPGDADAIGGKAYVLEWMGRSEEARKLVEPLVQAHGDTPQMAKVYSKTLMLDHAFDSVVDVLERHLASESLPSRDQAEMWALVGKARERQERIAEAFTAYARANRALAPDFSPAELEASISRLIGTFSADAMRALPKASGDTSCPVFIAGMPRSGTTLLDRILDAHPDAYGLGETDDVRRIALNLSFDLNSTLDWPEVARDLDQGDVDRMSTEYLNTLCRTIGRRRHAADKSISNITCLGLIAALLPQARIIFISRDPLDTCFSCFAEPLLVESHPWSTDLAHIAAYHAQHQRLVEHWRAVLDVRTLEVQYETLIGDPEPQVRRVLEFVGLGWDDRCLRFHESGRPALTFSYDQVRRPLYHSSIGRAQRFREHLGPLIAALER